MTDLTEMVEWLKATVRDDLEKAKEAAEHPQMIASFTHELSDEEVEEIRHRLKIGPAKMIVLDHEPPTVDHRDLADTIARCEAELEIIDEHPRTQAGPDRLGKDCKTCSGDHWGEPYPCTTLRLLAYGYRHRPGWKEGWAP